MDSNLPGGTNAVSPTPVTLVLSDGAAIPVLMVNKDGTPVARRVAQTILGIWGAGLTIAGLLMGTVGVLIGLAWFRGPIEAVCIDHHWDFCTSFRTDYEKFEPELIRRYAPRDAGDMSALINGIFDKVGVVSELQVKAQAYQDTVNEAQERFDDPAWKAELSTKTDDLVSGLDGLDVSDPDARGVLDEFKAALTQVKDAVNAGDRNGFNDGMRRIDAVMTQFQELQQKLLTDGLKQ